MFPRAAVLSGIFAVFFAIATAGAAEIVTKNGERIECEIIDETETFYLVDHAGYRRYVLKGDVRTINREASGAFTDRRSRAFVEADAGLLLWGSEHQQIGTAGGRLLAGYPITDRISAVAMFHTGYGTIKSERDHFDLLSGPIDWWAMSVGARWETVPLLGGQPAIETYAGRATFDHTVTDAALDFVRSTLPSDSAFVGYSEPIGSRIALTLGVNYTRPICSWLALSMGTTLMIVPTHYTRQWYFEDSGDFPAEQELSVQVRMVQFHAGLQFRL